MIKPGLLFPIALLALVASIWGGCESERDGCTQPQSVSLRAHCYRRAADTGTAVIDTALGNPILRPLDSKTAVFFYGTKNLVRLTLSLTGLADSSRWIVQPDSANQAFCDTLTFYYDRRLEFISNACGYTYYYNLTDVRHTGNTIDSVRIGNPSITNDANVEHLRIYY